MDGELSALGVAVRRRYGHFDAELVGAMRLAFSDALHLRGVQRIDLRRTLALLLIAPPPGPRQDGPEDDLLEPDVAVDLSGDVADDAAQIGPKRFQGPVGALELLGVGIALMLDQGE